MKSKTIIDLMDLMEMANVAPRASGLKNRLFFSWKKYAGSDLPHGPRFKIDVDHAIHTVNLASPVCPPNLDAKEWKRTLLFIDLNRKLILRYWNKELEDPEFHAALQPVK